MSRIYLITLLKVTPNPLGPVNDEVNLSNEPEKKKDEKNHYS